MRHLILMRHGKSSWPDGTSDHARPLAPRGEAAAPLMARAIAMQFPKPDLVLVSDARRTQETYQCIANVIPDLAMRTENMIYAADMGTLLDLIRAQADEVQTLMIVGHNPGMQELATYLADPHESDFDALKRVDRKYPTAGVVHLVVPGLWEDLAPGSARLDRFLTPSMLGGVDED